MTDASAARPRRRWKYLLIIFGALIFLALISLWYINTDSFQGYVRSRIVQEVERITGGHAEVGSFHVVPFHLQVEVRNITVHGKEDPADVPLAHADSLLAQLKVISLARKEFGFINVSLDHPVVHIAISSDGTTTNVPGLRVQTPVPVDQRVEQLFALSIDHLSVRNGELLWGDKKIPLDFAVSGADLHMDYSFLRRRYESHLTLGKVDTNFDGFRPFSWMASANFSLGTSFADISSLTWNSGRSSLKANGRISDFRDPRFDGTYDAQVEMGEAAAIARRNELRQGVAQFKGTGHWSLEEFRASGVVAMRDVGWQDKQFSMKDASANADYTLTDQQFRLTKLQGKILGGSFTGDAEVENWFHSEPLSRGKGQRDDVAIFSTAKPARKMTEKTKTPGIQSGVVHLRVHDISTVDMANALEVNWHPLHHFRPAGLANGSVDALWRESPNNADVSFALSVNPPAKLAARELPVTAQLQGRYRGVADSLELSQFTLSTPSSKIQASGTLASPSAVHVSVSTSNLDEWRPLILAFGGPSELPFRVDGNAGFNGVVGGTFSSPTLAGTLAAQDFAFTVPATSRTPEKEVQWDSLSASMQFSTHELNVRGGTLRRGNTSADFELSAILQKGHFTEDAAYTAKVDLHHVDVAATAALAGFDYPVSGTADLSLQIGGTREHPQAQGHIHAVNASAYGEKIDQLDADLQVQPNETALTNIRLAHDDAQMSGTAAYAPSSRVFRLDLAGKNFDIARVRQIHLDRLPVSGRADFTLKGTGTLGVPEINAAIHVRDLTLGRELAGGMDLEGVTKNGQLRLSGYSEFTHGTFKLDGTVEMHGNYMANLALKMEQFDLDSLWAAYLGQQLTGHSAVSGTVAMEGPLRYPRRWRLNGTLPDLALEVEYAKLHSQGPVNFAYADQTINIAPAHFVGEGTDMTGQGSIQFSAPQALELSAAGHADLRLLGTLDPNLTASGLMSINMTVAGTLRDPLPQGTIQLQNGAANYAGLPSGLSEMNGKLSFTRERIHIDQLAAKTGGGSLDLKGDVTHYNGQFNFNLSAAGRDVRLRYPPGVSSTANADLKWVGSRSSSTISGDVMVTKLAMTPGFDFGSYLERSRQTTSITPANSPLYNVKLAVNVRTAPELQMKTAVARLSGDADLRLRGSVARPSVLGRADILEGDATFNGIKFRLERGDVTFANPVAIEPQVNLQATTHVRNYDLDVTVTGTPDRLNINYRSEPPLPKSDIIALLALGRTSEESEQLQQQSGQTMFSDVATAMIINQAINATVSNRLQKLFGVSRIKIDPQGLTTYTNPTGRGPQVTIEEQFANNLSLTYSTNVSQSGDQIIQGEYYIDRNVSIVGTRDQNGVVSFDLRIRRRRK
ncbi:MAG TPA: translocation/assembly module TamB domain-containing protein [Candidatus Sulfotelmatobacter sp.]|nr:translocation/assembly module TamB domain-containing protein [Candidatus Sulfotelmatobacter sp.]